MLAWLEKRAISILIQKLWTAILVAYNNWQTEKKKKAVSQAIEDLKNAKTEEERKKYYDIISNNSF